MKRFMLAVGLLMALGSPAQARDPAVAKTYLKSLGLTHTPKGCQVDHVVPLHCGGPDVVENLQLICGPALAAKEKHERNCKTFPLWQKECLQ